MKKCVTDGQSDRRRTKKTPSNFHAEAADTQKINLIKERLLKTQFKILSILSKIRERYKNEYIMYIS